MGPTGGAMRADARRNREALLRAAVGCFRASAEPSMGAVAEAAGVRRATLYAHFDSRAVLVEDVMRHVLAEGEAALAPLDLTGDPREALGELIAASWRLVDDARGVLAAAEKELDPGRIRELHAAPAARAEELIARGQTEGVFRDDLGTAWLVATMHHVMHGAADEVAAGRLDADAAAHHIGETLLGAFAPRG